MKTLPGQMQTSQTLLGWPQSFWVDLSFCGQIGQLCRIWHAHMEKFLDDWDDRSNWRLSQKSSLLFLNGWGNRDERYWNQALTVTEDAPIFTCYVYHIIFNILTGQKRDVTKQKFLWLVNTTLEWPETVPTLFWVLKTDIQKTNHHNKTMKTIVLLSSRVITWDDKFFISINNSCSTRNNKIFTNIPEKGKLGKL